MNHILTIKRNGENSLEASCSCGWSGKQASLLTYVHELSNEWKEHVKELRSKESTFIIEVTFKDLTGKLNDLTARCDVTEPIQNMTSENLRLLCYAITMSLRASSRITSHD